MSSQKLTDDEVDERLDEFQIWGFQFGKLATRVEFENYEDAVFFANQVFNLAEDRSHRPEVKVTDDAVEIDIWTPDIGVTESDFQLADDVEKKLRSLDLE